MRLKVFTVFDIKAEAYLQPFFMTATGSAIRAFTELVNDKGHNFGKHPSDFTLFQLAEFDDATGEFFPLKVPVPLGTGNEFLRADLQMPLPMVS